MEKNQKRTAAFLIHWLGDTGDKTEVIKKKEHFLASVRLRIKPAMEAANLLGLNAKLYVLRSESPTDVEKLMKDKPELVIIGKLSHPEEHYYQRIRLANLAAITILKANKIPIILDYSDNLAVGDEPRNHFWKILLNQADKIIVPTKEMKNQLNSDLKLKTTILMDPLEGSKGEIIRTNFNKTCETSDGLKLLWFGHSSNLNYLCPWLINLREEKWPFKITINILTTQTHLLAIKKWIGNQKKPRSKWKHVLTSYKCQENVFTALNNCHIALIPSALDPNDSRKRAASHNRVSETINAGRLVIANSIPAYKELLPPDMLVNDYKLLSKQMANIISSWSSSFQWIESKQEEIQQLFSYKKIVNDWKVELKLIIEELNQK